MITRTRQCGGLLACLLSFAQAFPGSLNAGAITCLPATNSAWESLSGRLTVNGVQLHLKGINIYGLDLGNEYLGLDSRSLKEIFEFLQDHKFNAIRLPFSTEFALSDPATTFPSPKLISANLRGITSYELVDMFFAEAASRGMLVLLDMHNLAPWKPPSPLWYDPDFTEAMVLEAWVRILKRYVKHWNLFGVDLKNECHGDCSWGMGNITTDFNLFVERAMRHVHQHVPEYTGLFFVEGIYMNTAGRPESPYQQWWGGNLFGADQFPIRTGHAGLDARIVYSPHIYGPDVYMMDYFKTTAFPENLGEVWDNQFGWLIANLQKAVVVGEWGGSCNGIDATTQEWLARWLVDNCLENAFWWALPPGSQDTGGLMNANWTHYDAVKMSIIDYVQPNPSVIRYTKETKTICITHGQAPNPACRSDPVAVSQAAMRRDALRHGNGAPTQDVQVDPTADIEPALYTVNPLNRR